MHLIFLGFFDEYTFLIDQNSNLLKHINVLTVTFDQFNASLQNKSINFFHKTILLTPNWEYQVYNFMFTRDEAVSCVFTCSLL